MVARRTEAASGENIGAVRHDRPQNGAEYLESLRDGREVYIYGDRVEDVTTHPAFRNTARMTARLFDALHDPKRRDKLLVPTDTDGKGKTHAFFRAPKTVEESIAGRDAIAEWQRITYGWMGRSPDYKAAFLARSAATPSFMRPSKRTRDAGMRTAKSACCSLTTRSFIRPWIETRHPIKSQMSACT
jgi:4-hydroxyphenylacetate 3-monooxygenase